MSLLNAAVLGGADFPEPVIQADCSLNANMVLTTAYFEGYSGLKLVMQQQASLLSVGTVSLRLTATQEEPITRIILRVDDLPAGGPPYTLRVEGVSYITAAQMALFQGQISRCGSISKTGGKLSFLPNYDYEVAVVTEVRVSSQSQGQRSSSLSEFVYFRTKGLPGLNSVTNTGDEIEPYIDSLYPPAKTVLLYRAEPVVVSFTDGISSILPVDRAVVPTIPPTEKTQTMELMLNIDRVGSTKGLSRLTVPSGDWIDAHRALPPPPRLFPRAVLAGVDVKSGVRKAPSFDPLIVRFLAVQGASSACAMNPLQASQVLIHEPIGEDDASGPWQPSTTLRATVRQKDGPYTERSSFDLMDSGAFLSQAEGTAVAAGAWGVNQSGSLIAPGAGAGRQYASFGELTWNHLQAKAQFDPQGVSAGIAVGVGDGAQVPQALIATVEPDGVGMSLVLRAVVGGVETVLGSSMITAAVPLMLTVVAFDDTVRAQVGDVVIEASRGAIREGRVALVASGAAIFSGLSVDGLDLYRFDFSTSRYMSFEDHIQSWNGTLAALDEGGTGASSASIESLLSTDVSAVGELMQASADPQARQALFTKWVTALTLPLRQSPASLCLSRLTDAAGSRAFLIESPEPISFTRDVSVSLVQIVPWQPIGTKAVQDALAALQFDGSLVSVASLKLVSVLHGGGDAIVTVSKSEAGTTYSVYSLPQNALLRVTPGHLTQTIGPQAGKVPIAVALQDFPDGAIALLAGVNVAGAINPTGASGTATQITIPLVVFDNGLETTTLLIPTLADGTAFALASGHYVLRFNMDRKRWRDTDAPDVESVYLQQQSLDLFW